MGRREDRTVQFSCSTNRSPSSTWCMVALDARPLRSVRNRRSSVTTCETLTTDRRVKPVPRRGRGTLPGAAANRWFEVMATTRTVAIWLLLKSSDCTTSTGRLYPGSEPVGTGRLAHQISPRLTGLATSVLREGTATASQRDLGRARKEHLLRKRHRAFP